MSKENYLKDISEIKNMMNKSSRFISLSGMSGVLAGVYALIGAFVASKMISEYSSTEYLNSKSEMIRGAFNLIDLQINLILVAIVVIFLSITTGIILSYRKAKKIGDSVWSKTSQRLLVHFLIPLITGGILCLVLLSNNIIGLIAPFTLIFYGLACVNASKYTIGDIQYLGITNIILGLVATQYIGYGLYFWTFGFGVLHIVYGTVMYLKYDKK